MKKYKFIYTCLLLLSSISILVAQNNLEWFQVENLPAGLSEGSCSSATDCDVSPNRICYALVYTPQVTGQLLSYTTFFSTGCESDPDNPAITYNVSCVINDNSQATAYCPEFDIKFNSSANTGSLDVVSGTQYLIHEICFEVEDGESKTIHLRTDADNSSSFNTPDGPAYEILRMPDLVINADAVCDPLPVQYLSFDAKRQGGKAALAWVTAGEINNEKFEIERSHKGYEFHKIGEVKGAGTTSSVKTYSFFDEEPHTGRNYYRLRQVDTDGDFTFSRVREVRFSNEADPYAFSISPNPAQGGLTGGIVTISGVGYGEIKVYNAAGKLVMTIEEEVGEDVTQVSVKNLGPGVYMFKNDLNQIEKVIIL